FASRESARTLSNCLGSIRQQGGYEGEIIVVDNMSLDRTCLVATDYGARVVKVGPRSDGFFAAPFQRRMGADEANGKFLFFADSDFILTPGLLEECLEASKVYDALIVPEHSFGLGGWAKAKIAGRACY